MSLVFLLTDPSAGFMSVDGAVDEVSHVVAEKALLTAIVLLSWKRGLRSTFLFFSFLLVPFLWAHHLVLQFAVNVNRDPLFIGS